MMLNVDRIEQRQAMRMAAAFAIGTGGEADASYFEALCDTEEEAREMAYEHRMRRKMAAALSKFGGK